MKHTLAAILLGAGFGRRFGQNKLLFRVNGLPLYRHAVNLALALPFDTIVLVTNSPVIRDGLSGLPIHIIPNPGSEEGIASSIRLGLSFCLERTNCDSFLFSVCDQPYLKAESVLRLMEGFQSKACGIACLSREGVPGNPVIFEKRYAPELLALSGDTGGRAVMRRHPADVLSVEVSDPVELRDVDTREDLLP